MRTSRVFLIVGVSLLACFGCSKDEPPDPPMPTVSVSTSATLPTTTTATAEERPAVSLAPEPVLPSEPITFECGDFSLYQSGTALYSDGTTGYEAACDTYVAPEPEPELRYCDYGGTAVYTDGSYVVDHPECVNTGPPAVSGYPYNEAEDRNGDGVVNGYERCGVLCGEEPTSGDIQTQHGCEQGYITGPQCE